MNGTGQIDKLADFIMAEVPGEPSRSEGVGDMAIRIIRELREQIESQARQIAALTGSIRDISTGWDETLEQLAAERAES